MPPRTRRDGPRPRRDRPTAPSNLRPSSSRVRTPSRSRFSLVRSLGGGSVPHARISDGPTTIPLVVQVLYRYDVTGATPNAARVEDSRRASSLARGRHGHARRRRRARGRDDRRHDANRASSPPVVVRTGAGRARAPRSRRRQRLRRDDHGPPMGRGERPSPGGPRPRPSRRPALELETPRHGGRGAATRRRRAEGVVGRGTYHPSVTTTTHQRQPPRDGDCHDTPSPRTSARPRKTQPPPPPFGFSRLSPEVRPTLTRPSPLSDSSLPTV